MIYKITNKQDKTWNDKKYVSADLVDTNGELFPVSAWGGEFDDKTEIDCELEKNEKGYWKIKAKPKASGGFAKHLTEEKKQAIAEAQQNKAKQIEQAQDRSAWMWSKTNASTLIANSNKYKDLDIDELADLVQSLATKIYNSEPITPF